LRYEFVFRINSFLLYHILYLARFNANFFECIHSKVVCSGIIVDLNVFSATVNKPTLIEPSPFKTCVSRSNLFISNGRDPSVRDSRKDDDAFRVREIHFDSDQYGLFISDYYFVVTLLIPKPKCESPRRSVAYYRCILLSNVLGKCTLRGQAIVCANCLRISDEICRPRYHAHSSSEL